MENSERIIHELMNSADFLKQNWTDSVGQQYITWIYGEIKELAKIEECRVNLLHKGKEIQSKCIEIIEEGDETDPKVLSLRKK